MKKIIVLSMALVTGLLVVFSGHQFYVAVSHTATVSELNTLIARRSQQQAALQITLKKLESPTKNWQETVQTLEVALVANIKPDNTTFVDGAWASSEIYKSLFRGFEAAIDNLELDVFRSDDFDGFTREQIELLADALALATELQSFEVQMSQDLASQVSGLWYSTMVIDVVGGLLLVLLWVSWYISSRESSYQKNSPVLVADREKEFVKHQTLMTSLLEDMKTERNRALAFASILEQKNQEMEQFIYTVSHDLKSPLVAIGGFSRKIEKELSSNEKVTRWLGRIQANLVHMEGLLEDLLELSRVVRQEVEREWLDPSEILDDVIEGLDIESIDSKTMVLKHEPIVKIFANKRLFTQAIQNLVSNAIQYRSKERPLEIEFFSIENDDFTEVRVKDNGIGVEKKYHDRIFNLFERLDVGEGTGVGLAIVKMVMSKHEGSVEIESNKEAGVCFSLSFPNSSKSIRNSLVRDAAIGDTSN